MADEVMRRLVAMQRLVGPGPSSRRLTQFIEVVRCERALRDSHYSVDGLNKLLLTQDRRSRGLLEHFCWLWRYHERQFHLKKYHLQTPKWSALHEHQLQLFRLGCSCIDNHLPRDHFHGPVSLLVNFVIARPAVVKKLDDLANETTVQRPPQSSSENKTFFVPTTKSHDDIVDAVIRIARATQTTTTEEEDPTLRIALLRARLRRVEMGAMDTFSFPELILGAQLVGAPITFAEAYGIHATLGGGLVKVHALEDLLRAFWSHVAQEDNTKIPNPNVVALASAAARAYMERTTEQPAAATATATPSPSGESKLKLKFIRQSNIIKAVLAQSRPHPQQHAYQDLAALLKGEHTLHRQGDRALRYHDLRCIYLRSLEESPAEMKPSKAEQRRQRPKTANPGDEIFALKRQLDIAKAIKAAQERRIQKAPDKLKKDKHDRILERSKRISADLAQRRTEKEHAELLLLDRKTEKKKSRKKKTRFCLDVVIADAPGPAPLLRTSASAPLVHQGSPKRRRPKSPTRVAMDALEDHRSPPRLPKALGPQTKLFRYFDTDSSNSRAHRPATR